MPPVEYTYKEASISQCGLYRYYLTRQWEEGQHTVMFVMLNPSTADADQDDPTIRRCVAFARAWGFKQVWIGNLFAYRATDPRKLLEAADPVGPDNIDHLAGMAFFAHTVVAAWGVHGALLGQDQRVLELLKPYDAKCLGKTRGGHPRHPLYVASSTPLEAL